MPKMSLFKLNNGAFRQVETEVPATVSPNVVRKLFQKLVHSDFRTVYKGRSWTKKDNKTETLRECFCKHGMYFQSNSMPYHTACVA